MNAIIEVANLTKSFGHDRGISDVDFQVTAGEVFGFGAATGNRGSAVGFAAAVATAAYLIGSMALVMAAMRAFSRLDLH